MFQRSCEWNSYRVATKKEVSASTITLPFSLVIFSNSCFSIDLQKKDSLRTTTPN